MGDKSLYIYWDALRERSLILALTSVAWRNLRQISVLAVTCSRHVRRIHCSPVPHPIGSYEAPEAQLPANQNIVALAEADKK